MQHDKRQWTSRAGNPPALSQGLLSRQRFRIHSWALWNLIYGVSSLPRSVMRKGARLFTICHSSLSFSESNKETKILSNRGLVGMGEERKRLHDNQLKWSGQIRTYTWLVSTNKIWVYWSRPKLKKSEVLLLPYSGSIARQHRRLICLCWSPSTKPQKMAHILQQVYWKTKKTHHFLSLLNSSALGKI